MDAPRYNSPSRKSRFRSTGASPYRQSTAADEVQPTTGEEVEIYPPEEAAPEVPAAESEANAALAYESPGSETGDLDTLPTGETVPVTPEDQLPAGLRLTRSTDRASDRPRRSSPWLAVLTGLLCLALGGAGGYLLRGRRGDVVPAGVSSESGRRGAPPTLPLAPAVLSEVDTAFEATKQGKFADARQDFTQLAERHRDWPSMRIEAARAALYEHNFDEADKILSALLRAGPNADAEFLSGLLQMTLQTFDKSEAAFGRAVAVDPTRPDFFYFWGECLRREGKPQDAADKFRQALIRNQYETTEGLYQLKLWLSEIQADQETANGINSKIDADLASGHPSGAALFAGAARDIKAGRYKEAGEEIGRAQKAMDPAVFRVVLQDPIFLQENFHPELAPFYK